MAVGVGAALAAMIAMLAFGAAAASADSIVYIKNNDVWLAEPDGSNETQVTDDGTAGDPYYSPSQANDGTILALKGDDINAQFHRLNQDGPAPRRAVRPRGALLSAERDGLAERRAARLPHQADLRW